MRSLALFALLSSLAAAATQEQPRTRSRLRRGNDGGQGNNGNGNGQGNNGNNQGNNGNHNGNGNGGNKYTTTIVSSTTIAPTTDVPSSTTSSPSTTTSAAPSARTTCVVPSSNFVDDTAAANAAAVECKSNAVIEFSAGVDYIFQTPVTMSALSNVEIRVNGNLHLPTDMATVIPQVVADSNIRWFTIAGSNVDWVGSTDVDQGWVEGYGQQYWDANPANGTGITGRPHLFTWTLNTGTISHLKVRKPPAWVSQLKGNNIEVSDTWIDATTHDGGGFPFNTDGFDVGATNVHIHDMVVHNGDDAVAINQGATNVLVERVLMSGPGSHGMSIGSLGKDPTVYQNVSNIHFKDVTAVNSLYAARFKSYDGGWGDVKNVTWENFHLVNVTFPIYITQTYYNQAAATTTNSTTSNSTSAVNMDSFTWKNWRGTINSYQPGDATCVTDPCWYAVDGADRTQAAIIACATESSCTNYVMDDVQLVPQAIADTSVICSNVLASSSPSFGIVCANGKWTSA